MSLTRLLLSRLRVDPLAPQRETISRIEARLGEVELLKERTLALAGDKEKQPLLLIHGSPGSWSAWALLLANPELQKKYFLIAPNRPGYSATTRGKAELSLERQAQFMVTLLAELRVKKPVIVVGHSYGGAVAAKLALSFPEKVRGVLFAASALDPELEEHKWYQRLGHAWPWRHLIGSILQVCNDEILALKAELRELSAELVHWSTPWAIVHGTRDDLVPIGNVTYLKRTLSVKLCRHLCVLNEANHYLPGTHASELIRGIEALAQSPEGM